MAQTHMALDGNFQIPISVTGEPVVIITRVKDLIPGLYIRGRRVLSVGYSDTDSGYAQVQFYDGGYETYLPNTVIEASHGRPHWTKRLFGWW